MYNFTYGITAEEASMLTLTSDSFMNFREKVYAGVIRNAAEGCFNHTESFYDNWTIGSCIEMKLFIQELRDKGFRVELDKQDHNLTVSWKTPQDYIV